MASKCSVDIDDKVKQTSVLPTNENRQCGNRIAIFYDKNATQTINFARLEKGLLLFIYIFETSKADLKNEMSFWDHRICATFIKSGQCSKLDRDRCPFKHDISYRQAISVRIGT